MSGLSRSVAALLLAASVAGCAARGGSGRLPPQVAERIDRVLASSPNQAQPSKIVATELAFARLARKQGQWTAFRAFAAPDAVMHLDSGLVSAAAFLTGRADPPAAVQWKPRGVWMSCGGSLAVSRGRFVDPEGKVGTFVTVWELQGDGSYRWIYDGGAPDDPQPDPALDEAPLEDLITVEALETVQGHVADCPEPGAPPLPPPPTAAYVEGAQVGTRNSADATMQVGWLHGPSGERDVWIRWWTEEGWSLAMNQPLPGPLTKTAAER